MLSFGRYLHVLHKLACCLTGVGRIGKLYVSLLVMIWLKPPVDEFLDRCGRVGASRGTALAGRLVSAVVVSVVVEADGRV